MNSSHTAIASVSEVARLIDHAILQPFATDKAMRADIEAVKMFPLASICIKPYAVPLAVEALTGTEILTCTVIGFPHGSALPQVKALETQIALEQGAREIDMVANIGKAMSGDRDYLRRDIGAVLEVVRAQKGVLKVIFETGLLDEAAKILLCEVCSELEVDFAKTSTGFAFVKGENGFAATGATAADLELMREHCAPGVALKASGGMRSLDDVWMALEIGATRIGTTSTLAILSQARARFEGGADGAKSDADY